MSTTSYTCNLGRLANLHHRNAASSTKANDTCTYDSHSRLLTETRNGTDQLTSDGLNSGTYDANGNRTNSGYSHGTGNRLTSVGTWNYTYDDEGNQTK